MLYLVFSIWPVVRGVRSAESAATDRSFTITAGGSLFFDRVAAAFMGAFRPEVEVVIRAGCTITHDHGARRRSYELFAEVMDLPRPALAAAPA